MNKKTTIIASTLLIIGLIPCYAATRAKAKPATSKAVKTVAKPIKTTKKSATSSSKATKQLIADLTTTQKSKLLTILNSGTSKELVAINGVAKVRSTAIVKARPFDEIEEIATVKGIGKVTFQKIITHGRSLTQRKKPSSKKS